MFFKLRFSRRGRQDLLKVLLVLNCAFSQQGWFA